MSEKYGKQNLREDLVKNIYQKDNSKEKKYR